MVKNNYLKNFDIKQYLIGTLSINTKLITSVINQDNNKIK